MSFNIRMILGIIVGVLMGVIIGSIIGKVYVGTLVGVTLAGVLWLTFAQYKTKNIHDRDK